MTTSEPALDHIWFTRCPVPTASGLALSLGWLDRAFAPSGLPTGTLQDGPGALTRHHYDHELVGLFREGGNVPAIAARSAGARTRLIGLTWIDEAQVILVRPDSGIRAPGDLRGKRVAVPAWAATRPLSFPRAMSLHGYLGALRSAGSGLEDVRLVEVATVSGAAVRTDWKSESGSWWRGIDALVAGDVDAAYVKGVAAVEEARRLGLAVGIDLDRIPDRRFRVNNGTPRPITVHQRLLDERPELVVAFLTETLRAADWAADHLDEVRDVLERETRSGREGVIAAYGEDFHRTLHPDLSDERLGLLARQADFLYAHGFLDAPVDVFAWADRAPLAAARAALVPAGAR